MKWYDEVSFKCLDYKVSKKQLARVSNCDDKNLCSVLNGKRACSEKLKNRIQAEIERFNPKYKKSVIYDYVRVRFPTLNYEHIMRFVLQIEPKYFAKENYGLYGYRSMYSFQDIRVLVANEENSSRGTLIELSGSGCRKMEYAMLAQGRDWNNFFMDCLSHEGVFKRLDIAINDEAGILNVPFIAKKIEAGEYWSIFKQFSPMAIQKHEWHEVEAYLEHPETYTGETRVMESIMGNTIYIGSRKSNIYFCIYEKDKEQYLKQGIPLNETKTKNRFEIRLLNERAENAVPQLFDYENPADFAFGIIERYFKLLEPDKKKEKVEWKKEFTWQWFMGGEYQKVYLTTAPEPYTIEKTQRWLLNQVAPSLKLAQAFDELVGTHVVGDALNIKLPEKQQKILSQCIPNIADIISLNTGSIEKEDLKVPVAKPLSMEQLEVALLERKAQEENIRLRAENKQLKSQVRAYRERESIEQLSVMV